MTKIIKHNLRYQEERRTLYLNLADKDQYGRHRGLVLYGLEVEPASATSVRVRPGALHTPYGTKFFFDVVTADTPSINTLDLNALLIGGNSIFAAGNYNLRPIYVAIIAEVQPTDPSRQPVVESEAQMGASTIRFRARVISTSRATGQPTMNLVPVDPVGMVDLQTPDTDYDPIRTYDAYAGLPTRILTGGTPANESQNRNEIVLGYVVLGTRANGTPATALNSGSAWAEGVAFVRAGNAWEQVSDFLGHDVLLGRNSIRTFGAPVAANPSLNQTATTFQANGGSASFIPSTTPNYGTPPPVDLVNPWDQPWSSYRPPSFMKDGEDMVWQLRRLDYFLRLWMDRTGDQTLVNLIQDGAGTDQQWQSPLHRMLLRFTGGTTNNLNTMSWADGTPTGTIINHLLKSGVASHEPKGLADVLGTVYGDTHAMAIDALDTGILHILRDVLGFDPSFGSRPGLDRAVLRAPGAIARNNPSFLFDEDGPLGNLPIAGTPAANRPVLTGNASTAYLDGEPIMQALEKLARRASSDGVNLLKNAHFQAGDLNSGTTADLPGWTLSAGTWTRAVFSADLGLKAVTFTLPASARAYQSFTENTNLPNLIAAGTRISITATMKVTAGSAVLRIIGNSAAPAELFRGVSRSIAVGARYQNVNFSFVVSTATTLANLLFEIVAEGSGVTAEVVAVWGGLGTAPENPALDAARYDFVGRDGGAAAAMRGPFDLGNNKGVNVATPTNPSDAANKAYVDSLVGGVVAGGALLISATGAYDWVVPAGVFTVRVVVLSAAGAGGSGGKGVTGSGDDNGGGGGGGGGASGRTMTITLAVTPGDHITGVVGAGGTPGGINSTGTPTAGGVTTLVHGSFTYTIAGGLPGTHGGSNVGTGGLGGPGGAGTQSSGAGGDGGKGDPGQTAGLPGEQDVPPGTPGTQGSPGTGDASERGAAGGGGGVPKLTGWLSSPSIGQPTGGNGGRGGDGDGGAGIPAAAGAAGSLGGGGGGGGGGGADNGGGGDETGKAGGPGGDGAVLFAWGV